MTGFIFHQRAIIFVFALVFFGLRAEAVLQGLPINNHEAHATHRYLARIITGDGRPGSATYLGHGVFLTAAHVVLGAGTLKIDSTSSAIFQNQDIRVRQQSPPPPALELAPNQYEILQPGESEEHTRSVISCSNSVSHFTRPDLVLIKIKNSRLIEKAEREFEPVALDLENHNAPGVEELEFRIAGISKNEHSFQLSEQAEPPPRRILGFTLAGFIADYEFSYGQPKITYRDTDTFYRGLWEPPQVPSHNSSGDGTSAAYAYAGFAQVQPGDSGGPLLLLQGDHYVQVGVTSNIQIFSDEPAEESAAGTSSPCSSISQPDMPHIRKIEAFYINLAHESIAPWLREKLRDSGILKEEERQNAAAAEADDAAPAAAD